MSEENEPYSDDKILTKIFQLIIQSLDGIQSPDDEGYDFHFRVLESISTVQSYIVMNDFENGLSKSAKSKTKLSIIDKDFFGEFADESRLSRNVCRTNT